MPPQQFLAMFRDRLAQSRFFTISLALHMILVVVLGGVVIIKNVSPPEDMRASMLVEEKSSPAPIDQPQSPHLPMDALNPSPQSFLSTPQFSQDIITTPNPGPLSFPVPVAPGPRVADSGLLRLPAMPGMSQRLSAADLKAIGKFTDWREPGTSNAFTFTAFLGRYRGGNWNSTVRVQNGEITGGSLPNLLYAMSKWSKDKIKTNERNVKAIELDSPELLTVRPPFVFLTGTRDFKLTEKEVENLRLYLRSGGAVWGDSSVPGRRSAFDIAFRREMRRVLPDGDQNFEALPENHEIFAKGHYRQVRGVPEGVNHYREAVEVLRWGGEIAVIHTRNDYGDMWQVGLDREGKIDLSRNEHGQYVAMNSALWDYRGSYVRNLEQPAVEQAYRFGINMVFHLLTRWEDRLSRPGTL